MKAFAGTSFPVHPKIANPMSTTVHTKKKSKTIESSTDLIKNLNKLNQQIQNNLTSAESQRDIMIERIEMLEEQIIKDQDLISLLRAKVAGLSHKSRDISQDTSPRSTMTNDEIAIAAAAEITPESILPFLQNRPLMLYQILRDTSDTTIEAMLNALDPDLRNYFVKYSVQQLDRFVDCFDGFRDLANKVQTAEFPDLVSKYIAKIYKSDICFAFIKEPKSGEFVCSFNDKALQLSLKNSDSIVASVSGLQKPTVLLDPSKYPDYSPSLDPLFNPDNLPEIIIPVGYNAVFMVLKTNSDTYDYANEDLALGTILSIFLSPLIREHILENELNYEVDLRRSIFQFENELMCRNRFEDLLPFLALSLTQLTGSTDIEFFIYRNNSLFSFSVEDGRLIQNTKVLCGTIEWVLENKLHLIEGTLDITSEYFNRTIDGWAEGKAYAAFPILADKNAIGVLAVAEKLTANKFQKWDTELLESCCNALSCVVPRCLDVLYERIRTEGEIALSELPIAIEEIDFTQLESEQCDESIAKIIQNIIKCEILTVYKKIDNEEASCIITLRKGQKVTSNAVGIEFVDYLFSTSQTLNDPDASHVEHFDQVGDIIAHALLCVVSNRHQERICVIAINSLSVTGQFDDKLTSIVYALTNFFAYGIHAKGKNIEIQEAKSSSAVMSNVFKVSSASLSNENPTKALLSVFTDLLMMQCFCVARLHRHKGVYECILGSDGLQCREVSSEDPLFKRTELFATRDFSNSDYKDSPCAKFFSDFSTLVCYNVDNETAVLFTGSDLALNHSLLFSYFIPVLVPTLKAFIYEKNPPPLTNSVVMGLLDMDIASRIFVASDLKEEQQVEAVVRMFSQLKLLEEIGFDTEKMIEFVYKVKESYNNVPFHNWIHAVDSTQFVFACLIRNKFGSIFSQERVLALMIATLLHDVGHNGQNTAFHTRTSSPLTLAFGEDSTVERMHCSEALKILGNFGAKVNLKLVCELILETDTTKPIDLMKLYEPLNSFDWKNMEHKTLLLRLLINCGNVANCVRPFYFAKRSAESIVTEFQMMNEIEKKTGVLLQKICDKGMNEPLPTIELAFIERVASPLIKTLAVVSPDFTDFSVQLEDNQKKWKEYVS